VRTYRRSWLRADLVAGVVLAAILVPQGMAYAELAGLPAATGLYTTIACLVGYAVCGPSRVLVLGPDSSISPLILAAITPLLVTGDPASAVALAGMLVVLVGLTEIGLGLGKLGFVADLLSKEVQVGYMNGLAITIIIGQLPKLFGFSTHADSFLAELRTLSRFRVSWCIAGRPRCSLPTPAPFRLQIRKLVRDREPQWVVLQCEAVTDVDVTAAEMLDNELNAAGTHLAFVEMRSRLQDLTLRYGLLETLDREHFYPTLEAALEEIQAHEYLPGHPSGG
jgi:MFS superfamily sulfate permease-like transporter